MTKFLSSGTKLDRLQVLLGIIDRLRNSGLADDGSWMTSHLAVSERMLQKALLNGGSMQALMAVQFTLGTLQGVCGRQLQDVIGDELQLSISLDFAEDAEWHHEQALADAKQSDRSGWAQEVPTNGAVTWLIENAPRFVRQTARLRAPQASRATVCADADRFDLEPALAIDALSLNGFTIFFS
jgi:hypothetical protein